MPIKILSKIINSTKNIFGLGSSRELINILFQEKLYPKYSHLKYNFSLKSETLNTTSLNFQSF